MIARLGTESCSALYLVLLYFQYCYSDCVNVTKTIALAAAVVAPVLIIALVSSAITAPTANAISYKGVKRDFYLFNMDNPRINETKVGLPADMFSMSTMTVTK